MYMRGVFAAGGDSKTEYAIGISAADRQPAFDQMIQHAIERDAVKCWQAQREFDLAVRQRCRCRTEQSEDANTSRRSPSADVP